MSPSQAARPRLITPAFVAVAAATLAYFIADGMTLPTTPRYVVGPLDGDDLAVGLAVGSFSVTALVLRPWVGHLVDRRGRRPLLIAGATLFAIGMLGHLVAASLPLLVLMRLMLGAGEACLFVAALSAVSDLAPDERRGEAMSYFSLSLYLGIAIGPVIGEALLGDGSFPAVWIAAAATAVLAALFALRVPETRPAPDPAATEAAPPARPRRTRLIHPAGVLPGLVLLASTAGMGGFFAFVPLYSDQLGIGASRFVFLAFAAIIIAFRSLMPWMPDRLGARRAATVALSLDALGLATIALWATPLGLFAGTAVFAFGVAFAFPALSSMAVAAVPASERGAVLGTFSAFLDLAFGLGPVALGLVAQLAGYREMFLAASAIALAGLALLYLSRVSPRARVGAPAAAAPETFGS